MIYLVLEYLHHYSQSCCINMTKKFVWLNTILQTTVATAEMYKSVHTEIQNNLDHIVSQFWIYQVTARTFVNIILAANWCP